MVACFIDKKGTSVGIDIEQIRERIKMIAPKFVTENDNTDFEDTQHFHIVWGAKEVLYKIYSLKQLDFKDHIHIEFKQNIGKGFISKNEYYSAHFLEYIILNDFMLVWGW